MTQLLQESSFDSWAEAERQRGRAEFTIAEVRKEASYFFKPMSQRTVYDIARTYSQVLGVEVRMRKRRNFSEQVFTSEQVVDIFCGISRKLNSTYSYAEVFAEMRRRKGGGEPSEFPAPASQSGSGDSSEVLAELRSLRAEVAQLRGAGSNGESSGELEGLRSQVASLRSEVEQLRRGALTRTDLWRAVVTMVGLSGGDVSPERFMAYLGVDESELEAMSHFGLDGAGE